MLAASECSCEPQLVPVELVFDSRRRDSKRELLLWFWRKRCRRRLLFAEEVAVVVEVMLLLCSEPFNETGVPSDPVPELLGVSFRWAKRVGGTAAPAPPAARVEIGELKVK